MTTQPASPSFSVNLPEHLQQQLQGQHIAYQLRGQDEIGPLAQRVQPCLLSDASGLLLAIFPADHLLDLAELARTTGREMEPVRQQQLQEIFAQHQIGQLPGLPLLSNTSCVIDPQLLTHAVLWLPSGVPGSWLEMDQNTFSQIADTTLIAGFTVPLSNIIIAAADPEQDRSDFSDAVQNFTALRVRQRLEETIEIPPLSNTTQQIMKLRVNPDATIEQLTDVVETDPSLAAQVVSWASSSYYAAPVKIRSVEDAITRVLGFDLVTNLAVGLSLGKTFSLPKDAPEGTPPYWEQAIYCAAAIEGLAMAMPREQRPELGLNYLAGLLHNFGYLVLAYIFPPHFQLICRHLEANPHVPPHMVDQHLLGVTREQIGSWLMRYWDMPPEVPTAIRHQHAPDYAGEHHVYANLIYLSNALLREQELGDRPLLPVDEKLLERLGLSRDAADQAIDKVLNARDALRKLVNDYQLATKR